MKIIGLENESIFSADLGRFPDDDRPDPAPMVDLPWFSGARWLAARCDGDSVIRLQGSWRRLLSEFDTLGVIRVQSWNSGSYAEMKGRYCDLLGTSEKNRHALSGRELLLPSPADWEFAFALRGVSESPSIQLFSGDGQLAHKIFLTGASNPAAYEALVKAHRSPDQSSFRLPVRPLSGPDQKRASRRPIDRRAFRSAWATLRDTWEMERLVQRFRVSRRRALSLAGDAWATQVPEMAVWERLQLLAELHLPCAMTILSGGTRQTVSGGIEAMTVGEDRIHFSGEGFDFYLCYREIHATWVITLPGAAAGESFLECYNRYGKPVAQIQGWSSEVEAAIWQDIVNTLPLLVA